MERRTSAKAKLVLGIETSCDETAAAVVAGGRHVLSNVVSSQVAWHRPYGGVVPEVASRRHVETLPAVIEEAVARAGIGWDQIDEIAVTYGPGLASSLLVGLSAAKALAIRLNKPLRGVNHLEGHIASVFLTRGAPRWEDVVPFIALLVSGGHTCLIRVEWPGGYRLLGQTVDDAAGEALDKGASLLGLPYPGGPAIEQASAGGNPEAVAFPRSQPRKSVSRFQGLDPNLCFSFSGLKTALRYHLYAHPLKDGPSTALASIAASYQEAVVDALVSRCTRAITDEHALAVGGGVSLNRRLRKKLAEMAAAKKIRLLLAEPAFCADNAAMIATAPTGIQGEEAFLLDVHPNLALGEIRLEETSS